MCLFKANKQDDCQGNVSSIFQNEITNRTKSYTLVSHSLMKSKDFIIIEKVKKMIDEMTYPEEVEIITKYAINAVKKMHAQGSNNIPLLEQSLPYGIRLMVKRATLDLKPFSFHEPWATLLGENQVDYK